jgi:integrating conjugative element protein (TIGR03759 family)
MNRLRPTPSDRRSTTATIHRVGTGLAVLLIPAAAAVETQSTVQPTQIVRPDSMPSAGAPSQPDDTAFVSPFRREAWGLSEAEWHRYLALMQGIRGAISPKTLSPLEVLGIHAETEAERRNYARRFARLMQEDAERLLAFQRAYDQAWREFDPAGRMIDPARLPKRAAADPMLKPGDRLVLFTRLAAECGSCKTMFDAANSAAETADVPLDIYFTDAKSDDAIRAWISRQGFDEARIRARKITFNHDRGTLTRAFGVAATTPKLVRKRGPELAPLEPYQLVGR